MYLVQSTSVPSSGEKKNLHLTSLTSETVTCAAHYISRKASVDLSVIKSCVNAGRR